MNHQKAFTALAAIAVIALGQAVSTQRPQTPQRPAPTTQPAAPPHWGHSGEVHDFHVQGKVHLLVGAGGNIAVQIGEEGVLVVDTGMGQHTEKVLAAIRKLSDKTIRYIVNTHFHPDHTGGNAAVAKAGQTVQGNPTAIVAHENVLNRMSAPTGTQSVMPTVAWPTSSYISKEKDFFFNGEPVMVFHAPAAHTDGDSIVLFRRSDVIMAGDIFVTTGYPVIDNATGGGVQGVIDGLNHVLALAVPQHDEEGGTYVIPGHGRVCDEADVLEYRDMVTIVRDRIKDMVSRGLTLEQVKAARPTLDYELHYGSTTGPWTTAMFIEAIYKGFSPGQGRLSRAR